MSIKCDLGGRVPPEPWNVSQPPPCSSGRAIKYSDVHKNYNGPWINTTILNMPVEPDVSHSKGLADISTPIPESWSWREKAGNKIETNPRNQGSCGGCWSFSVSTVLGDRFAIKYDIKNPMLSTTWLIACGKPEGIASNEECLCGGNTYLAGKWLEENGNKLESCWPYSVISSQSFVSPNCPKNLPDDCCSSCCQNEDAKIIFKVEKGSTRYIVVHNNNQPDVEATTRAIQREIMSSGPVTASFQVTNEFMSWWKDKASSGEVYVPSSNSFAGGHAVVLTGWGVQNGIRYWEMRNSWGNTGDNGFCKFAFSADTPKEYWTNIDIPIWQGVWIGGVVSFQAGPLPSNYKKEKGTGGKSKDSSNKNKNKNLTMFGLVAGILLVIILIIILVKNN